MTEDWPFWIDWFKDQHSQAVTDLDAMRVWGASAADLARLKDADRAAYDALYAWCKADLKAKISEPC